MPGKLMLVVGGRSAMMISWNHTLTLPIRSVCLKQNTNLCTLGSTIWREDVRELVDVFKASIIYLHKACTFLYRLLFVNIIVCICFCYFLMYCPVIFQPSIYFSSIFIHISTYVNFMNINIYYPADEFYSKNFIFDKNQCFLYSSVSPYATVWAFWQSI